MTAASDDRIVIEVPWRSLNLWSATIASGLFAVVLAIIAASGGSFSGVFRIVMAGAASMLVYVCATFMFNRSWVVLDETMLSLSHGPLPWSPRREYLRENIALLRANPDSRRFEMRTTLGEEHILLTALPPAVIQRINAALPQRLRS